MKGKNIVEEVRKFVEEESKKPTAHYGYEPYPNHLVPMRDYAVQLAKRLGADAEIVELATWLHDIGSIMNGREDHHIIGAKITEKKLKELGYPQDRIEKVKHCILSHRASQKIKPETVEAQIISDADAISNFDNIPGIFMAAFIYENQSQQEAKASVRQKLERKWERLVLKESRDLIKPRYEAIKLLLK